MKAEAEPASGKSALRAKMLHHPQAMTSDERIVGTRRTSITLGICFAFQLVETIPIEPHDAIMNAVISD
jgi:hypothetical protein